MKKIVGILAVAALFATSVFASDISAATKIEGKIFAQNGTSKQMDMLSQGNGSHDYANPNLTMSIADDQAGATVKLSTDGGDTAIKMTTQTIWFKPVDALKISVGNYDLALNKEQIKWTESITGLGGNGFVFSINADAVSFDIFLNEGNGGNFWMSKPDGADPALKEFGFKFGFAGDFGNIGAFVDINRTDNRWTYHDALAHIDQKADTIKNVMFGAGYRNTFSGIDAFVNVVGYMGDKFDWIRPEVWVKGSADAFGYALFAAPCIWVNSDLNKDFEMQLVAKLSYALDGATAYAQFDSKNLLADTFAAEVKLGASGNVGAMGWNAWLQLDVADKTNISVPFELTMGF